MRLPTERRFPRELIGGILLLCTSVGGYTLMHVFFFGIPHFTTTTDMGKAEIGYALANLALACFGTYLLCRSLRRNHGG